MVCVYVIVFACKMALLITPAQKSDICECHAEYMSCYSSVSIHSTYSLFLKEYRSGLSFFIGSPISVYCLAIILQLAPALEVHILVCAEVTSVRTFLF